MCGIVGIFNHSRSERVSESQLRMMRDTMTHRGPDDSGIYINPDQSLGLGHRRLSIIDLSELGRQPMTEKSGRIHITYNGEIYNFRELRDDLEKEGVIFRSRSDTEVLLYLYTKLGEGMLDLLRGMFAFAIWDEDRRRLFLARDRIGVKPLYYFNQSGTFAFASEIKALLASGEVRRDVNAEAFYHYLSFLTTPAPQTLFDGIYKLPAGHWLSIDSSGNVHTKQWWTPLSREAVNDDEATVIERVRGLLEDSVRYRMVSDVPFGVFLSGGIDSSSNVALMARMMDRPVESFSIAFRGEAKYNELQYAKLVADKFQTNHHETEIGMTELIDFLPQLIHHQDEPIADPVCIPVYFVAKLAKESGVTVCQVGEGSDELFCGYPQWSYLLSLERLRQVYAVVPRPLRELAVRFATQLEAPSSGKLEYLRRASSDEPVFWGGAEAFFETHKRQLLNSDYLGRVAGTTSASVIGQYFREFVEGTDNPEPLNWMTFVDLKLRLPELLLMRVDKMTMATAVEARVPFLDHKLVEYVMSLPQSVKTPNSETKHILKRAVSGIIPDEIINRPKQGFAVPITEWLQRELGDLIRMKLTDFNQKHRYFDKGELQRLLQTKNSHLPWYLFNFALWHETWIEQKDLNAFPDLLPSTRR
jgi:asparagine synthase (glutamine-hydrolysing)